jgi:hypothetical protein
MYFCASNEIIRIHGFATIISFIVQAKPKAFYTPRGGGFLSCNERKNNEKNIFERTGGLLSVAGSDARRYVG